MRRFLLAATTFVFVSVTMGRAADPPVPPAQPTQPQAIPIPTAPPGQLSPGRPITALTLLKLEEEVETLEAQRETRKACVTAAEVTVKVVQTAFDRISKVGSSGPLMRDEFDKARLDVEAAKAQLDVKIAEMKEVEVKIKYAKIRLENAKGSVVTPTPKVEPKPADPTPVKPTAAKG